MRTLPEAEKTKRVRVREVSMTGLLRRWLNVKCFRNFSSSVPPSQSCRVKISGRGGRYVGRKLTYFGRLRSQLHKSTLQTPWVLQALTHFSVTIVVRSKVQTSYRHEIHRILSLFLLWNRDVKELCSLNSSLLCRSDRSTLTTSCYLL